MKYIDNCYSKSYLRNITIFFLGVIFSVIIFIIYAFLKIGYSHIFDDNFLPKQYIDIILQLISNFDWGLIFLSFLILVFTFIFCLRRNDASLSTIKLDQNPSDPQKTEELIKAFDIMTKSIEERKIESQNINIESQNKYVVNICHELRTPMYTILNLAEVGYTDIESLSKDKISYYFQRIEKTCDKLIKILNSISDIAKFEEDKVVFEFKNEDIKQCILSANASLAELLAEKKLTTFFEYKIQNTKFHFDKDRILQVMINLISNAIKFSPEEGVIKIIVSDAKIKQSSKDINACKIQVIDQGLGILQNEQEEIFKKFVQNSLTTGIISGSGLGLAICKKIIEKHKGEIWVQNTNDGGAEFVFVIPLDCGLS